LIADEVQRLTRNGEQLDRRHRTTVQHFTEIVQRRDQILHRFGRVRLQVAASDDALARVEIDENERPVGEGADARNDRSFKLEHDRPRRDALECQ